MVVGFIAIQSITKNTNKIETDDRILFVFTRETNDQ
jgi:hypothetical protein